jgi:cell division protein ZapA (FtsZ GTPase activity inhibitor)
MNADDKSMVRVNIYGHEYTVKAVAGPDYISDIAAYVDRRMRETEANLPGPQSITRVAILAAMSITDELMTERRKRKTSLEEIEKRTVNLSNMVDDVLETAFRD